MVVIRHFRPRRALMLPFLDGLHDLSIICKAIHTVKLLLAVQQHWPQSMLEPRAASGAFDFSLVLANQWKHGRRVGRHQCLVQLCQKLHMMKRRHSLKASRTEFAVNHMIFDGTFPKSLAIFWSLRSMSSEMRLSGPDGAGRRGS